MYHLRYYMAHRIHGWIPSTPSSLFPFQTWLLPLLIITAHWPSYLLRDSGWRLWPNLYFLPPCPLQLINCQVLQIFFFLSLYKVISYLRERKSPFNRVLMPCSAPSPSQSQSIGAQALSTRKSVDTNLGSSHVRQSHKALSFISVSPSGYLTLKIYIWFLS